MAAIGFEEFVAARSPALLRTAWLLTGDDGLAEDLVQTALAKAWPRWDTVRHDDPEGYVRAIVAHTYATWWRRKWRGEVPTDRLPDSPGSDPYSALDTRESVRRALATPRAASAPSSSCATSTTSPRPRPPQPSASPSAP